MATTATASATTTTKDDDDDDDDYPTICDLDFASSFSPFKMPQRYNDDGLGVFISYYFFFRGGTCILRLFTFYASLTL